MKNNYSNILIHNHGLQDPINKHSNFDWKFNFADQTFTKMRSEIPRFLQQLIYKAAYSCNITQPLNQVIINEYSPKQSIHKHIYDKQCFGEQILGIGMGSQAIMDFNYLTRNKSLMLQPRYIFLLSGSACRQ